VKHSRAEGILENRRKTETQPLNPMSNWTTQDTQSLGITNRAQAQFLRSTLFAIDRLAKPVKKARIE